MHKPNRAQPSATYLRSLASDLLAAVRDSQSFNKEELFVNAIAFYRWYAINVQEEEELRVYTRTFATLYPHLAGKRVNPGLQDACFITWFVARRFHRIPPLLANKRDDMPILSFLAEHDPPFSLPENAQVEGLGYVERWVASFLDSRQDGEHGNSLFLMDASHTPAEALLQSWSRELIRSLPDTCDLEREALLRDGQKFFAWCYGNLRSWSTFETYMRLFIVCYLGAPTNCETALDPNTVNAHFIVWFLANGFDQQPLIDEKAADARIAEWERIQQLDQDRG